MTDTVIEAQEVGAEVAVREPHTLAVAPEVNAQDLVRRLAVIKDAMTQAMEVDVDYGVIPGTGGKPTLLKPGAEKLGVLFQLDVQLENEKHFDGDHLTVVSRATVYHAPSGTRLGSGEGLCSTREAKYAWRKGERVCPACGAAAIIKGKAEFGGGWLCWKKRDGCGAKFNDGETVIEGQNVDKVPNPELADCWNTVEKMASKRARIDAVLAVTGASALFAQDVEKAETVSESEKRLPETRESSAHEESPSGNAGSDSQTASTRRKATKAQLDLIETLRAELEASEVITPEQFAFVLQAEFNVTAAAELTTTEASTLIGRMRVKQEESFGPVVEDDPSVPFS